MRRFALCCGLCGVLAGGCQSPADAPWPGPAEKNTKATSRPRPKPTPAPTPEPKADRGQQLLALIPAQLRGIEATHRKVVGGIAGGAYLANEQAINVNLQWASEAELEQHAAELRLYGKTEPGTSRTGAEHRAVQVGMHSGYRTYTRESQRRSLVVLLIGGHVLVRVSVTWTDDPDHAVAVAGELDLDGIANVARK